MKERLIELLKSIPHGINTFGDVTENLYIENVMAKHLLANGVIVPPCKVGEVLYKIHTMYTPFISELKVENYGMPFKDVLGHWSIIPFEEIGKTVFLTREEAEAKLKEGAE